MIAKIKHFVLYSYATSKLSKIVLISAELALIYTLEIVELKLKIKKTE